MLVLCSEVAQRHAGQECIMNKPKWVCIDCGMWSSRKYSVKRHILNVHGGISVAVPFIEYIIGRHTGVFSAPSRPVQTPNLHVQNKELRKSPDLFEEMYNEFWKEKSRQAARRSP
jgi:hypothetical protein